MAVTMKWTIPILLLGAATALACGDGRASSPDTPVGDPITKGAELFNANCALCHGRLGDLGMGGAKDLTVSTLTRAEMITVVTEGRKAMMPYRNVLTPKQIEQVVDHVRTLRKAP